MSIEEPQPRYRQLADLIRTSVEQGEYPPGGTLPSETELAQRYEVNRAIVNRALLLLRGEGLIRVERGNRTTVRQLPVMTRDAVKRFRIRDQGGARGAFEAELAQLGREARTEVQVSEGTAPGDVATLLAVDHDATVLTRTRRMLAGDIPIQLATSWLPLDIVRGSQIEQEDTGPGGTYSRLGELGHAPDEFTETIQVRLPTDPERKWLGMDTEQRVYFIRRIARDANGRVAEVTDTILPAHQWILSYSWEA